MKSIVLGGGCFWCLEAAYQQVDGVTEVVPGYAGGYVDNPTYEQVCEETTGHAEVVRVTYDDVRMALDEILRIFFLIHDPTSLNKQGADVGTQYRSVVFFEDQRDESVIRKFIEQASQHLDSPVVTEVVELPTFYEAEPYHHNYFQNHPEQAYCQVVIQPKLAKLRNYLADTSA